MIILLAFCVADNGYTWATSMWLVLVHPVPILTVDWSYHFLLLVDLFVDTFTLFPTGTIWLGCPNLGAWLEILGYIYVHTLLRNGLSYIHSKMVTHTYMWLITSITLLARVGWTCCYQPPSVGHSSMKMKMNYIKMLKTIIKY